MPRLMFFLPWETTMVPPDAKGRRRLMIIAAATALLGTLLQPLTWTSFVDLNVPLNGALGAAISLAAIRGARAGNKSARRGGTGAARFLGLATARSLRKAHVAILAMTFCYSFLLIPLGLQDHGSANMFSSLRLYGGSNHFIFPTGLLQRAFHNWTPSDGAIGEAFGGGIVRVEATTSSYLSGPGGLRFPGEQLGHSASSRSLLSRAGHSGRQVRIRRQR